MANQLAMLYVSERQLDPAAAVNGEGIAAMEAAGLTNSVGYLVLSGNQALILQMMGEVEAAFEVRSNLLERIREMELTGGPPAGFILGYAANLLRLARYDEVKRGRIDHALRFTADRTRRAFIYPARHFASSLTDRNLPAMGQRLRLRKGYDISGFPRQARIVLKALKRYGMILADNGSPWYISGMSDPHFDDEVLHELDDITGRDLEVVDTSGFLNG